jgi:tRNA threonylcarbamoyl adenosine modification protein YeaZ
MAINKDKNILAIESSQKRASMVIEKGGQVFKLMLEAGSEQSCELVPLLKKILESADLEASDLSDITVHVGPGSATGLRMGIAMVQAIALVCPEIKIHAIPLEALALSFLKKIDKPKHNKALLLANAYGGSIFVQKYIYNGAWLNEGEIKICSYDETQQINEAQIVLSDLGNLKSKIEWPEQWQWNDECFMSAEGVLDSFNQGGDFSCKIENLDVRYLKATSAELNWKK